MFNNLTRPILNDLLTSWIPLVDIGRLDFALCEPVHRKQFLELLQIESFGRRTTADKFKFCSNPSFLSWAVKRKVKLQLHELVVDDALMRDMELQNKVFALVGPNLKKITASNNLSIGHVDSLILELLLYCTNLEECQLTSFNDTPMMALLARNPKLKSVKLCKCVANKESEILHAISALCLNIEVIAIDCTISSRSFARFFNSIPSSLTNLCLPFNNFAPDSLLNLLRQCPRLLELRIAHYSPFNVSKCQLVHPCLKVIRLSSNMNVGMSTWIPALSQFIPNLSTMIVVAPVGHTEDDLYKVDSVENVTLILNNFRCLRQLLIGSRNGESKLSELSPMPLSTVDLDKPSGKHATRRKYAVSGAGDKLEELFSNRMADVVKAFSLPALRSVGCSMTYDFALPVTVKRLVANGGYYCSDERMAKLRNLEELELELDSGVTDAGMNHIAHQNPHLRVLCVTQRVTSSEYSAIHPAISAAGLWAILQHCPLLHTVLYNVIRYNKTISATDPLLQRMCLKTFPNIKHLEYSV